MDIRVLIGKRIRQLRQDRKITQEELSNLAGLDRTYIASVEAGRRNISIVNIYKISTALGISLKEFFSDEVFSNNAIKNTRSS